MTRHIEQVFWSQYARFYDNLARYFRPYRDLVTEVCDHIRQIGEGRSLRVLDAGCGTGNYSWELAHHGHQVIGIDRSLSMLRQAVEKHDSRPGRVPSFFIQDLDEPLPFPDHCFDVTVCVHVLYAVRRPGLLLSELHRVLRPRGIVLIVNANKPAKPLASLQELARIEGLGTAIRSAIPLFAVGVLNLLINRIERSGHFHFTDSEQIRQLLLHNGFSPLYISSTYTLQGSVFAIGERGIEP